ncbi:mannan endo-1,4-beta-mannosidase-like [Homarus americanus]|uniref:Mannan endo-1-4-beta-mannosidase-like n=1 Tax=Homarus americanus TaxID=6706 RepID=A0A8J5JID7_HOMAM|nr:mannan endo-1,4-beta-mannosidase-like [Homarus americanus]XP_042206760.1 mannan endo-1,4-beta-mannosidase-like [Homarus americanus]KAG7154873.1 Mannan endo-1-4-beta-mannosidase-like [Homarus americanus]
MARLLLLTVLSLLGSTNAKKLKVSGTDLTYGGEKVFLNGCNIAWHDYGRDFGNGDYDGTLEQWVQEIASSGGNSIRAWVHVEGYSTPVFDDSGHVTACDKTGDFEDDVLKLLNAAEQNNVLVTLTMWNGAYLTNQKAVDLIMDDDKLESYIENCLNHLMTKIKGHPALAAFEAVNEAEGSVKVESNSNSCYDTTIIGHDGAGWTGKNIPMHNFLRFIGRQNEAVRAIDPDTLITLGSWGQFSENDVFFNSHNHYTDQCLNEAAGGSDAQLDFYQMHTYDWSGSWSFGAPFTVSASDYMLNKPIVIGEFASVCAAGTPLPDLYEYAYTHGYSGAWTWHYTATGDCSDSRDAQRKALGHLKGRNDHGVINFTVE